MPIDTESKILNLVIFLAGDNFYDARHFDTLTNKTLFDLKIYLNIKAKRETDLIILNMGLIINSFFFVYTQSFYKVNKY